MNNTQGISVFIGSTIKSLEDNRIAVRDEIFKQGVTVNESINDITGIRNCGSKLVEVIKNADFFIGIYASKMPQELFSSWSEELSLACEHKSSENLLLFLMKYSFEDDTVDNSWKKLEGKGYPFKELADERLSCCMSSRHLKSALSRDLSIVEKSFCQRFLTFAPHPTG